MRLAQWAWVLAAVATAIAPAQAARAQQAADAAPRASEEERLSQARTLFEEGLTFVERGEWAAASQRFQEVLRIRTSNVVAYNLAFALVQLGRLVEAAELLRPIARDPTASDVGGTAKRLLSEVEPKLGIVTVRLSGDVTDTTVFIGEHAMALERQGTPVEVDPGSHEVRVERDGVMVASRHVDVGGEQALQADLTIEVPPRVQATTPPAVAAPALRPTRVATAQTKAHAEPSEPITSKAWFWAAGAGVVVAATVTVLVVALAGGSPARDPVAGDAGTIAGKVIPIP